MPRTIILYILLIALLITGCSPSFTPEPLKTPMTEARMSTPPALVSNWTVKMAQSGGIMGVSRSIEISSAGKFTVADTFTNKTITGKLSADELSKTTEQIKSAKYIPGAKPDGMGCVDCFIYDLEILKNGEKIAVQLNDVSLPNSGLEPLVTYLRDLVETTLK